MPCMGMLTSARQLVTLLHAAIRIVMFLSTENASGTILSTTKLMKFGQTASNVFVARVTITAEI